jgi:hypothetical protein
MGRRAIWVVTILGLASCVESTPTPADMTAAERAAITDSVGQAVTAFVAVQGPELCRDLRPFAQFFTYPGGQLISAADTTVTAQSPEQYEAMLTDIFCGIRTQDSRLGTTLVQVLAPTVAIAAWTFDEQLTDTSGITRHIKGSVMQPWVRAADGWRASGAMSAHVVVPDK